MDIIESKSNSILFTYSAIIFYPVMTIIAVLIILFRNNLTFFTTGNFFKDYFIGTKPIFYQISLGILIALIIIIISIIARKSFKCVLNGERDIKKLLGDLSFSQTLIIALLSGIAEEFLFRGAIQPWIGIWGTSIMFGIMHLPISKNLFFYPIVSGIIGFLLGWTFQHTGSLITPIIIHFLVNFININRINSLKVLT